MLAEHRGRHDGPEYTVILKQLLKLFGESTHISLQRTMGDFLESTAGKHANSKLSEDKKALTSKLRCENDTAERSFAVMREMHQKYPSMSLSNLSGISIARLYSSPPPPFPALFTSPYFLSSPNSLQVERHI